MCPCGQKFNKLNEEKLTIKCKLKVCAGGFKSAVLSAAGVAIAHPNTLVSLLILPDHPAPISPCKLLTSP